MLNIFIVRKFQFLITIFFFFFIFIVICVISLTFHTFECNVTWEIVNGKIRYFFFLFFFCILCETIYRIAYQKSFQLYCPSLRVRVVCFLVSHLRVSNRSMMLVVHSMYAHLSRKRNFFFV